MSANRFRFWILVSIVAVSGFSQGMLLPLIAVIFENSGVSSFLNGVNATALYIGILLASPFMELPLRRYGYKPLIITGGFLVLVSLALFPPLWQSFWFWFCLRLLVGMGDHALNFGGAQTWITAFSPDHKRGRNIAVYGLFFGIGFAVGPLMVSLVEINESLPFIISACLTLLGWLFLFTLKNEWPEQNLQMSSFRNTFQRFAKAWKYAWIAFLPPFAYGFLETSLNGNFPVYALRIGMEVGNVSALLFAFAIGAIVFQLPLGMLSDKLGRRKILTAVLFLGFVCFLIAGFIEGTFIALFACLFIAGMFVGSMFSLGITYMTDLMPRELLPTGNLLCGVFFSLGSLIGPSIGGLYIQLLSQISFFYLVSALFLIIFIMTVRRNDKITQPL
ncbi:major facilitator family transporter [Gracilibacillus boraciitolerans JCM 21714]|uniref:Major facilitator family transporter n=1 Tax=Gracilibacillus boraciitolerans JCM 21714 TaxID=1298598 RepID=W4VEC9_9BACI|nr:MFS transporter [Gracilibacillus boraciitolerans]GAE91109.1 major facilitator family transporter [Gracilibacillus boraciitolerans JCM 21714]